MNGEEYIAQVKNSFLTKQIRYEAADELICYEEVFKWEWVATKMKITSFLKTVPTVTGEMMAQYSDECLKRAVKERRGLPRGFQNGVASFNVLASDRIAPEAIQFVSARPKKHFTAFEMPVVIDTKNELMYCYSGEIIWGVIYDSFIHEYFTKHFYPVKGK